MNKPSLLYGLITIQFLLIAFLMFKVLSGEESSTPSSSSSTTNSTSPSVARSGEGIRIAYINNDSLIAGYQYQQELRASLEKQAKTFEADLQRKSKVFEENYAILEQQAPNLSQQELQMAQADLMQKQQELIQYRDEMAQKLAEEEARLTQDLKGDLDAVVNLLREEEDLDFIFTLDPSSVLLYASSSYDITSMVIERLNASHAARQQTK